MMTNFVNAGDKDLPFKFSKRCLLNFTKKTNKKLDEGNIDLEDTAELCLQALLIGYKNEAKEFNLTIEDIWDLDDKYDIIDKMMQSFTEDEKKQEASSQEQKMPVGT